jgi:hypothetical protein
MLASPPIHVIPDDRGTWRVEPEGSTAPVSRHGNATDAERAALRHADQTGARGVIVHDRYGRLHRSLSRRGSPP